MARWKVEYYEDGWVQKAEAVVSEITEELSGHEEAAFLIPNTADNRTFVATDWIMRIKFDDIQVFLGALFGVEYSQKSLKCTIYNGVYELLKRRVISGNYLGVAANVVAEDVRLAASLANPLGACPTTPISVNFDQTLCFDAIVLIAKILNKDYWTVDGSTLYIGARGSSQSFDGSVANASSRGIDRSKKRDKVHVRGVDENGNQLLGVAGTGDNVAVLWNHNTTTEATLDSLASQKLAEINSEDSNVSLTCPITSGVFLQSGDTIDVVKPELNLSGSYRIVKLTKHRTTVEIEISRAKKTTEQVLEELSKDNHETMSFTSQSVETMTRIKPNLISGANVKASYNLSTSYLKESCILPVGITVASPTGNMNSYEGGYIARALIYKNGSGERDLARDILDEWAEIQNADGSWYQQYNPYLNGSGLHDRVDTIGGGYSGDLKVDSGAALLAWAMSEYDQVTSGTRYQTVVKKALQFLRDLQYAHTAAHSTGLIANLVYQGTVDTVALAADCAECLLAMTAAMDAYGDSLTTSGGYSVKTMANDVYYSLCNSSWQGEAGRYYATSFPIGEETEIPFTYKEKISYTAALCAWANYVFANSGHRTVTDYPSQAEKALDFINTITAGQWGGQQYCPYVGNSDETQNEYAGYTGLMTIAMNTVNATKYAAMVSKSKALLKWMALSDGRIYDVVKKDGELQISKTSESEEGYGFLSLPVAQALLAGA